MTRLERAGLIERTRDPHDRRRIHVRLSAAGRELADAIHPAVDEASMTVTDGFTLVELDTIERFLAATATAMAAYRTSLSPGGPDRPHRPNDGRARPAPCASRGDAKKAGQAGGVRAR